MSVLETHSLLSCEVSRHAHVPLRAFAWWRVRGAPFASCGSWARPQLLTHSEPAPARLYSGNAALPLGGRCTSQTADRTGL